jgi:hypothetical protein
MLNKQWNEHYVVEISRGLISITEGLRETSETAGSVWAEIWTPDLPDTNPSFYLDHIESFQYTEICNVSSVFQWLEKVN